MREAHKLKRPYKRSHPERGARRNGRRERKPRLVAKCFGSVWVFRFFSREFVDVIVNDVE